MKQFWISTHFKLHSNDSETLSVVIQTGRNYMETKHYERRWF